MYYLLETTSNISADALTSSTLVLSFLHGERSAGVARVSLHALIFANRMRQVRLVRFERGAAAVATCPLI